MSHRNYLSDSNTLTGEVLGVQYGYADSDKKTTPTYAYIAGDITAAYNSSTVTDAQRRMLAVYDTGNADVPLFFFVFDNVTAKSSSYKKTFLLHIPEAPTITDNKIVKVEKDGARLVLQNVVGTGVTIKGVGGSNNNYNVNGTQIWNDPAQSDGFWGRVEITTNSGSATDQLVNVMYVCDSNKNPSNVTATAITGSTVAKGAAIGNVAAVFITSKTRQSTGFSFTASGSGTMTYYVSGVAAGKWTITSGGKPVSTVTATQDGGLLVFTAPAGTVNLVKN